MPLSAVDKLGASEIVAPIGVGGMDTVHLSVDAAQMMAKAVVKSRVRILAAIDVILPEAGLCVTGVPGCRLRP